MTDLELQIKILELFRNSNEYAYNYRYFEKETGEPKERIKKRMDILKGSGYVEYVRGIISDEGEVMGSGFALTHRAVQRSVREWITQLKQMSLEELKGEGKK